MTTSISKEQVAKASTPTEVFDLFGGEFQRAGVSKTIRGLDALGYSRGAIAKMLDRKYQHVRNVLLQTKKS